MRIAFVSIVVVLGAACAPAVQINGAVAVLPPECTPSLKTPHTGGVLDIGTDPAHANDYTTALSVDAPEKDITFNKVEMFFTTDQDRGNELQLGQVPGTPINANNERFITIGATSSTNAVVATIVTSADAALLQSEPFVASAIAAGGKAHVIANVKLQGTTAGGSTVESQLFPIPLELCAGCLTTPPDCGNDANGQPVAPTANTQSCFAGDDVPTLVCP